MSVTDNLLEFLQPKIGTEIHVGTWLMIDQERIDRFAEVTGDVQWIHTDPGRARRDSPYGATIAYGFLTCPSFLISSRATIPTSFRRTIRV